MVGLEGGMRDPLDLVGRKQHLGVPMAGTVKIGPLVDLEAEEEGGVVAVEVLVGVMRRAMVMIGGLEEGAGGALTGIERRTERAGGGVVVGEVGLEIVMLKSMEMVKKEVLVGGGVAAVLGGVMEMKMVTEKTGGLRDEREERMVTVVKKEVS